MFAKRQKISPLPLIPIHVEEPFRQWGIDFIGEINPPSSGQHKWILMALDYFTNWVEAIPTRNATGSVVINFMEVNILSHFGCPTKIITHNAQVFISAKFIIFCEKFNINIGHSTTYYPQGKSPFALVYGKVVVFLIQLAMSMVKLLQEAEEEPSALTRRINWLVKLHENKEQVGAKLSNYQQNMKSLFDKKSKDRPLQPGDLVLQCDVLREDKGKHKKFDLLWFNPFKIAK
eukprot:PITA_30499